MGNSTTRPQFTTAGEVRKALRRVKLYRNMQKRAARRLRVSEVTVSKAASGRWPGRYKRAELALLVELARLEPQLQAMVERMKAELNARNVNRRG